MGKFFKFSLWFGVCAGLAAGAAASTKHSRDRYAKIAQRNVFALRQPAPQAEQPPPPPPLNVVLSGITTILGSKMALIQVPAQPGLGGQPARAAEGFVLTEGEQEGPIRVLQIDEQNGAVRITADGTPMTLTFEKNGPNLPKVPMPIPRGPQIPTVRFPGQPPAAYVRTRNPLPPARWSGFRAAVQASQAAQNRRY